MGLTVCFSEKNKSRDRFGTRQSVPSSFFCRPLYKLCGAFTGHFTKVCYLESIKHNVEHCLLKQIRTIVNGKVT